MTRTLLIFVVCFLLVACAAPAASQSIPSATSNIASETPAPAASATAAQTDTPAPVPATLAPDLVRPQYVLDLQLNYFAKVATVNETITYPNWTGETLDTLVLAVEPNLWSGGFSLTSLNVDGQPVTNASIDALSQKLSVPLPQPLAPSGTVTLVLDYGLVLPQMQAYSNPNEVRPQIYGFSDRQVNLVEWYPFVVPYMPGQGWLLHNPWFYGEHLAYDQADFDVTVTLTDDTQPQIAASGAETSATTAGSRRFVLEAGRTFALSMSTDFKVATQQVGDVTVYSYYFGIYDQPGQALLQATAQAIQVFSEKFGPYRYKTLTAVQGDFNDGMEFSGLYFISRDYFNLYKGDPKNYLITIGAHETAHQWWFDSVANDQGLEPWLDEAMATYSEVIFYENVYPELVDWWWGYRYFEFLQPGPVDTAIYDGGGQRPYWDKVYLTGARFFQVLRERLGDDIFFAFIRDYYAQYNGRRATGADFFRVLREHTAADLSDLMQQYFKNSYP